jgi:hypothetical protein
MSSRYAGISVDLSLNLEKTIVFEYKGTQLKLVPPQRPNDSDSLVCRMGGCEFETIYSKVYEFLSAVSYKYRVSARLGINVVSCVPSTVSIFDIQPFAFEKPRIAKDLYTDSIPRIVLAKTDDQSTLLRLYRQAFSAEDPYSKFLFYWHALVYPDTTDQNAINFINNNLSRCDSSFVCRMKENPVFLNSATAQITDLGAYFQKGIRHSIAHMTRSMGGYSGLNIDDLYEHEHLHLASYILEPLVRLKLERDYNLETDDDHSIYKVLHSPESGTT